MLKNDIKQHKNIKSGTNTKKHFDWVKTLTHNGIGIGIVDEYTTDFGNNLYCITQLDSLIKNIAKNNVQLDKWTYNIFLKDYIKIEDCSIKWYNDWGDEKVVINIPNVIEIHYNAHGKNWADIPWIETLDDLVKKQHKNNKANKSDPVTVDILSKFCANRKDFIANAKKSSTL